ncbi:MAG TPA: folylpolyglutamate synthase/dihydrofolate synthase family protein [Devosiaceae bacterium]|nr:folylpolyglutamate synthase/dihydrofolate synthase family protein [Devosiaceae bacterium]
MPNTDAILKRLLTLHPKLIDLTLERTERLLGDLGRPQDRLPPVIHVAGTNAKGSVIAYLRAMLEAGGSRVHVYTSPHLVAFRERVRLGGDLVSARRLNAALEHCEAVNAGRPITYFEITTAAALTLFASEPADFLLLETGLGGRLDATNVVDAPLGTIITPISIDHTGYLGETIGEIAAEKAGILKRGTPAAVGRQPDAARDVIDARCAALGILPFVAGRDFDGYAQSGRLVYQDLTRLDDLPLPRLIGAHQIDNAVLAVAAVRHFGLPVSAAAIGRGLRDARWPARLQRLGEPLRALLPRGSELWLDGAHNAASAEVLARALADMNEARSLPLTLVTGMMGGKAAARFFAAFEGLASEVITVPIPGVAGALPARELADVAFDAGLKARPARGVAAALASIDGAARRVAICGSLYLAGHVLKLSKTPPA